MAVAGLVHLVTVGLVALAVALLLLAPQVFLLFRLLGAALLVAVAVQVRPRPAPTARGNNVREGGDAAGRQVTAGERAQLPALFDVVHALCAALPAPEPQVVVVDDGFDVVVTGPARRRTLVVGFALWAILDAEQRAAALARALAEQVSGRLRDGGWVGAARGSVHGWTHLLEATGPEDLRRVRPRRRGRRAGPARTEPNVTDRAVDVTLALLLSPLAVPVLLLGRLLDRLVADDVPPRADTLAAAVVGSEPMLSLLEAATLVPAAGAALRRALEEGAADVWAAERAVVAGLPAHEQQRLRRIADRPPLEPADVPSLALRRALLEVAPRRPAQLAVAGAVPLADAELAGPAAELARSLTRPARRL